MIQDRKMRHICLINLSNYNEFYWIFNKFVAIKIISNKNCHSINFSIKIHFVCFKMFLYEKNHKSHKTVLISVNKKTA